MRRARTWLGLAAAVMLVAACDSGTSSTPDSLSSGVRILTGRADPTETGGSIETGEWTYGLPVNDVMWMDAKGTWHEDGRPECLPAGASRQIRFAAVEVTIEESTWRPVVWIDCRP